MTPADIAKALAQRQNIELEFDYEHVHAPMAVPVSASVVIGNKLKLIAVGGLDPVTQLAHDLFVETKCQMTGEECLNKAREFYAAVGREAVRMQAEMAAARIQDESQESGDQPSGIVLP
jgi:hypothetical protein